MKPPLIVLAGPNGAGKSTFFEAYLSTLGLPFLNADRLAAETGMEAYEAAAEIARIRRVFFGQRIGFVTETVLSDPVGEKVQVFADAAAEGFDVHLIYIGISSAHMSVERVASRVKAGGHDVPRDKLLARYERTLRNLERAISRLPRVTLYDNSRFEEPFRFIAEFRAGERHRDAAQPIPGWAQKYLADG